METLRTIHGTSVYLSVNVILILVTLKIVDSRREGVVKHVRGW